MISAGSEGREDHGRIIHAAEGFSNTALVDDSRLESRFFGVSGSRDG
jgi:hypothetical protein